MLRRRIPFNQVAFATLLGVASGIYIYKPYFDSLLKTSGQEKENVPKEEKKLE
ncbi:protein PIGBOS1 [Anabas testudineus]|uniref:Protein PIGBOS1 n=1 Tax=Anabas testudineus TaxID=64144 RepID=A0A7N6A0X2_ANATE|nr:protein PIGBOS1 [Anabas testudineus]